MRVWGLGLVGKVYVLGYEGLGLMRLRAWGLSSGAPSLRLVTPHRNLR